MADRFACAYEVATFLAFIEQNSPFPNTEHGFVQYSRWRHGCKDDLEFYLRLFHNGWSPDVQRREEWEKVNGMSEGFLEKVLKDRDKLLATLKRKDEKGGDRTLDIKRLGRVRMVFAHCLSEWTYQADPKNRLTFVPTSAECPCQLPVQIHQSSACLVQPDLKAFVCFDRKETRQDLLFAKHIVRINPLWLKHLNSAGPIGLSLLLKLVSGGSPTEKASSVLNLLYFCWCEGFSWDSA